MMENVLISLGSNMNPEANMAAAMEMLERHEAVEVSKAGPWLRTEAVGPDGLASGQEDFLNGAVMARTQLSPMALRTVLRQIEADLGRVRGPDKYAPRPIDLDIVFYGDHFLEINGNQIPDPALLRHAHVAAPAAAAAPDWVHPVDGRTLSEIAHSLTFTNSSPAESGRRERATRERELS